MTTIAWGCPWKPRLSALPANLVQLNGDKMTISTRIKQPVKAALKRTGMFGYTARLRRSVLEFPSRFRERGLRARLAAEGVPIPPADLLFLVAGTKDVPWFLAGGEAGFQAIEEVLGRHGVSAANLGRVLDFGCGCGRVLRHWRQHPGVEVHGTDYNPDLIAWCRANLGFAKFQVNGLEPPLAYPEAHFDLVYALSVFTHLTESLHRSWIAELGRIIRPGGFLVITTHGDAYLSRLRENERKTYEAGDIVVKYESSAGTNSCGAFHPERYIRKLVSDTFDVVDFIPEGAKGNPRQDLFLLRKL